MYGRQLKELVNCYISFHMKKVFNSVFIHCQIVKLKALADVRLQFFFVFLFPRTICLKTLNILDYLKDVINPLWC